MNVVFRSPHFPPQYVRFVRALQERGVRVLGVGDVPWEALPGELHAGLADYYAAQDLGDLPALVRALGYLTWRHGRIERIDSLNETWLAVEAELRHAFGVPGLQPADIRRLRSKSGMHAVFREAGVPHPELILATGAAEVRAFAARVGYPLVLKPDVGVGAARTFKVEGDAQVDDAFRHGLHGYVAQAYVKGAIVTYDGLVDRQGEVVFALSHEYSDGVMEVLHEGRDISFWSLKSIAPELERWGKAALHAFGLRERWFHLEFFRLPEGHFVALEANLRPPGGYMTDMMNFACDTDVYRLWTRVLTGDAVAGFQAPPRRHVRHVARRRGRPYALSTAAPGENGRGGRSRALARDLQPDLDGTTFRRGVLV